jgi:hypothetical protein
MALPYSAMPFMSMQYPTISVFFFPQENFFLNLELLTLLPKEFSRVDEL